MSLESEDFKYLLMEILNRMEAAGSSSVENSKCYATQHPRF